MENILDEPCSDEQVGIIVIFAESMHRFSGFLTEKVTEYVVEVDDETAEDAVEFIMKFREAAIAFGSASTRVVRMLNENHETFTKSNYYEALFMTQSELLPSIKSIESLFGDEIKLDGNVFSETLANLLAIG
jgi:hypothetical protein